MDRKRIGVLAGLGVVVGIKKTQGNIPMRVKDAIKAWRPGGFHKIIVVDEDVDIYDSSDVLWAIQTRCRPDRDILIIPGVSSYTREDVRQIHIGKFGIDATMPLNMRSVLRRRVIPGEDTIRLEDYLDS